MTLGLLISGQLGYKTLWSVAKKHKISCVFTDKNSDKIIKFADKTKLKIFVGNPRDGKAGEFIKGVQVDILLSVNYLFLIEKDIISLPKLYAINIHGSLLPKYRGRTPHVWAIINNESYSGITAHLINEGTDTGAIIKKIKVPIKPNDTGSDILKKYQKLYPKLVEQVLRMASNGKLKTYKQNNAQATYFGKRTPDDGGVNWNWQKERINNWVRALTKPYPGAFSHYEGNKIVFHKLRFSKLGFSWDQANGLILKALSDKLFVKTPNGVVILEKIENPNRIKYKAGIILK